MAKRIKTSKIERVRNHFRKYPKARARYVANRFGCHLQTAYVARRNVIKEQELASDPDDTEDSRPDSQEPVEMEEKMTDSERVTRFVRQSKRRYTETAANNRSYRIAATGLSMDKLMEVCQALDGKVDEIFILLEK